MGRPTVALHITTRLFREALSRALDGHVDVVIVPECPNERQHWLDAKHPVDLVIVSGVDGTCPVDAPVVVNVATADGSPVGQVDGGGAEPVRTLEDLLALLPDADNGGATAT